MQLDYSRHEYLLERPCDLTLPNSPPPLICSFRRRIPKDLIYKLPTTLLFSLEGLENLEWEWILKLQSADGSFLTSPSSTAVAFMHTKDEKCFKFIENAVKNCNGGGTDRRVEISMR